jgi:NAD(P)-dependent dehydrogenase (short-subunit alcohol dehydrogenase family)
MIDFTGQTVIVTGAGRGLGRLYALDLARRGANIVVNDLGGSARGEGKDEGVAASVVEEIRSAGGTAVASVESVASPEGGAAIVAHALDSFGDLHAVVHNAGIITTQPFDELSPKQWRDMLTVHLDGGFYVCQPAFRAMKERGYGRFVLTSSSAAMFGADHHAHYAAAKTGLFGLKNVIAIEGRRHGILANNVLPWGLTRMIRQEVEGNEAVLETPMMRMLEPELVTPLVVFLASRACNVSHHDYSAAAGRYAWVFTGIGTGWLSEAGSYPTADDIAANFELVSTTDDFYVPFATGDETKEICRRRDVQLPFLAPPPRDILQ